MQAPTPLPEPAKEALNKLQALCPMRMQHYRLHSENVEIWTACDIDPLLNALVEKENTHAYVLDERMPYWAELWPSSLLLAETIASHQNRLPEGEWLELGCGPGLAGIMAAKSGRKGVCSDYMQEALWLTCLNAHQNHCAGKITFQQLDWREPPSDQRVNWILAGDVAYEPRNFEPLFESFECLLDPQGEIWLGEPGRTVAKPFFRGMKENKWRHKVLTRRENLTIHRFTR